MLTVSILTDLDSWYRPHAEILAETLRSRGHDVAVIHDPDDLRSGDIAFLLSLGRMVNADQRARNVHTVVVHASALPRGKGWSPLTWQVIEGARSIPFTLFEAVEHVDAGRVYLTSEMHTDGTELVDELRRLQAQTTHELCLEFVTRYPDIVSDGREQDPEGESFYPRRRRDDSRLCPDKTLAEQFDLLRTCDPDRYPAHFEFRGQHYELVLRLAPDVGTASASS